MHELSIAIAIIDLATEELERQGGGRVETVHLRLGPLSGVIKEALLSAYQMASEASSLQNSRLQIQDVPVEIFCDRCGQVRPVVSIQEMSCQTCGTFSANIVRGRELEIFALEILEEPSEQILNKQASAEGIYLS